MDQPRNEYGQYVSLRDFVTTIMDERIKAHSVEHLLIDKALEKSSELVDARLDNLIETIKPLREFKDKALGFGALVALFSAVFGSVLTVLVLRVFG